MREGEYFPLTRQLQINGYTPRVSFKNSFRLVIYHTMKLNQIIHSICVKKDNITKEGEEVEEVEEAEDEVEDEECESRRYQFNKWWKLNMESIVITTSTHKNKTITNRDSPIYFWPSKFYETQSDSDTDDNSHAFIDDSE